MDIKEIWEHALAYIREDVQSIVGYNTYIRDAKPVSFENGRFQLAVSTAISKTMLELRYKTNIESALSKITAEPVKIDVIIVEEGAELPKPSPIHPEAHTQAVSSANLNPRYTFDNFVVGTSNEYATAVAMNVAKNPGKSNPLFLYGNSGLGKTHLMQAIGNEILQNDPRKKVIYITSEKFTNDMTNSIRDQDMESFRHRYREIDVLLVDDVQFIEGKEGTQEEFFHTFNDLYLNNKQIVLTSDRKPKDLVTLEERLRTRFEWGLSTDILTPDYETRVAILKKKAENQSVHISEKVLSYIAERVDSNVRELEGALLKIIAYAGISHQEIDTNIAEYALRSILPEDGVIKITHQKIMEKVCTFYNVRQEDLCGHSKVKAVVLPRQVAMYLCKTMTDMNFVMIAKSFGNRDRTTVMYAVDKIMAAMKTDTGLKADIDYIIKDLNSL